MLGSTSVYWLRSVNLRPHPGTPGRFGLPRPEMIGVKTPVARFVVPNSPRSCAAEIGQGRAAGRDGDLVDGPGGLVGHQDLADGARG